MIADLSLHETWAAIKPNLDWKSKRIPKKLIDGSDLEMDMGAMTNEILNG